MPVYVFVFWDSSHMHSQQGLVQEIFGTIAVWKSERTEGFRQHRRSLLSPGQKTVKVAKIAMGWASVELGLRTTTFQRESVGNGTAHLAET